MLSVSFRKIEYALAVSDHGGVTAAARALNVSQPSLSVSLAQLETELGRPLFVRRKGHGIRPTSFGRSFLEDARMLIGQARILMDSGQSQSDISGNVSFGCFEDLAPFYLARILAALPAEFSAVAVHNTVCGFDEIAEGLNQGTMDLALTYDLGLGDRVDRHPIASARPHALVAAGHRLAGSASVTLEQLAREPLVLTSQALSWQHILDLFRAGGHDPHIGHKAGSFELQRSLVANGLGVAVCYARPSVAESYDGGRLKTLPISDPLPEQKILLAHGRHSPPTAAVRALMETAKACVSVQL